MSEKSTTEGLQVDEVHPEKNLDGNSEAKTSDAQSASDTIQEQTTEIKEEIQQEEINLESEEQVNVQKSEVQAMPQELIKQDVTIQETIQKNEISSTDENNKSQSFSPKEAFEQMLQVYDQKGPIPRKERIKILKNIRKALKKQRDDIATTISSDFGCRSSYETLAAEIFITCKAIKYNLLYMDEWMESEYPEVDWLFWPAGLEIQKQPLGVVGIISPWNYPLQLSLLPLIAAITAGNRVLLKPSEHTSKTSLFLQKFLQDTCGDDVVRVILGDADVAKEFSSLPFHHLFFTGSTNVGKMVMRAASENLTPVTLELGGKSPAIIHESFSIAKAADRIGTGKMFNAGQTCIAPDYVLCPEDKVDELVECLKKVIEKSYPTLQENKEYTAIINEKQKMRLQFLLDDAKEKGANLTPINPNKEEMSSKIQPYILTQLTDDMVVMQEEIFGPILPIVPYKNLDDAINYVNKRERPLALYYFDHKNSRIQHILQQTISGGVCINDTILQVSQENMPFGGVGSSGMGAYHGKCGFDTFTHHKSIFIQSRFSLTPMLTRPPVAGWIRKLFSFLL